MKFQFRTTSTPSTLALTSLAILLSLGTSLHAQFPDSIAEKLLPEEIANIVDKHQKGAKKLAYEQDDLSADVQDLIDEQTDAKIINLMREIEIVMADATDLLEQKNTGGATIATQTEVIEKIFEAAKQKKQSGSGSQPENQNMDSMLQMMENMMNSGKDLGEGKEMQEGKGEGNGGGGGSGGSANGTSENPDNTELSEERRVPKNSGNTGSVLPKEFQKAMDAYNKGAQE
ncbi:MAG: hypothetical protein ACSHX0_09560 [Akkermansiaceae bacterium]